MCKIGFPGCLCRVSIFDVETPVGGGWDTTSMCGLVLLRLSQHTFFIASQQFQSFNLFHCFHTPNLSWQPAHAKLVAACRWENRRGYLSLASWRPSRRLLLSATWRQIRRGRSLTGCSALDSVCTRFPTVFLKFLSPSLAAATNITMWRSDELRGLSARSWPTSRSRSAAASLYGAPSAPPTSRASHVGDADCSIRACHVIFSEEFRAQQTFVNLGSDNRKHL